MKVGDIVKFKICNPDLIISFLEEIEEVRMKVLYMNNTSVQVEYLFGWDTNPTSVLLVSDLEVLNDKA